MATDVYEFDKTALATYATFAAWVSSIGIANRSVIIGTDTEITGTVVVPANIDIVGFANGAKFTGTGTLTINRMSCNLEHQIFDTTLTSVVLNTGLARPEWFGALTSATYQTNTTATQLATSALAANGGVVKYGAGTWLQGSVIPVSNVSYQGLGEATIIKLGDGANSALFNRNNTSINLATAQNNITFSDFVIDGNKANAFINDYNASAIQIGGSNITVKNIRSYNTIAAMCSIGVNLTGAKNIRILNCVVHNPGTINRYWGGIAVINGSNVLMSGNIITTSDGYMQYGLDYEPNVSWETGSDIIIENNTIIRGTINTYKASNVYVKNNTIRMPLNNAGGGAPIRINSCEGTLSVESNDVEQYITNNACILLLENNFTNGFVANNQITQRNPYQNNPTYPNSQAIRVVDTDHVAFSNNTIIYPGDVQFYSETYGGGIIEVGTSNNNTYSNNSFVNIGVPYEIVGAASIVKYLELKDDGTYHIDSTVAIKNGAAINILLNKNGNSYINDKLIINSDTYHGSGGTFIQDGIESYGPATIRGIEGPNSSYDAGMINPATLNLYGSHGSPAGANNGGECVIDLRANGAYNNLDYAKIIKYATAVNNGEMRIYCGHPTNAGPAIVISPVNTGYPEVCLSGNMMITPEGGIAHKYINGTGSNSVKGTVVHITGNNTADGIVVDVPDPIGVVYESGIANGSEMWVVTEGKAECLVIATCTAGQLARGFVTGDAGYVKGSLICENFPVAPFATDKHFYEFGHVNTGRTGAGLAMIQIHKL